MKSVKNVIIIVLSLIIVGLIVVYFTVLNKNNSINETKVYICTKNMETINNDSSSLKQELTYNDIGKIISSKILTIYKYSDKESYKAVKANPETTKKIIYHDADNTIEEILREEGPLKDEFGNPLSIWIVDQIEVLENDGYTCVIK